MAVRGAQIMPRISFIRRNFFVGSLASLRKAAHCKFAESPPKPIENPISKFRSSGGILTAPERCTSAVLTSKNGTASENKIPRPIK